MAFTCGPFHMDYCHTNSLWLSDTIWWHTCIWVNTASDNGLMPDGTNVDSSSIMSIGIHLRAISPETLQPSIIKNGWKITYIKFHWYISKNNELMTKMFLKITYLGILVLKKEFSRINISQSFRSILCQRMPWLLASPGHQQLQYWLCRIKGSLPSMGNEFN